MGGTKKLAVVLIALAGCGGGTTAASTVETTMPTKSCTELYAEGQPTAEILGVQCMDGDTLRVDTWASYECPDGRTLNWNDQGWGYSDGTWNHHNRPDGQLIPPDEETAACNA